MFLCNKGRLKIFPDNPPQRLLVVFAALHLLPEFFRHKKHPPPLSLSKLGDMRTGKKADLLKCLERSPLGSGNADEEEVLVDETNNTDYEETVVPVSDDIAIGELSDFISGTELEPCTQEEEQLISKDTVAYIIIIHNFYITLLSALEQTHCAHRHVILNERLYPFIARIININGSGVPVALCGCCMAGVT